MRTRYNKLNDKASFRLISLDYKKVGKPYNAADARHVLSDYSLREGVPQGSTMNRTDG